ncbi:conserved Plasmodium protein, unknown function [Plasmodium ovale wallikeri]|uniref:Uncharacterized protein n=2 Tax=Plasmodium ovale TaxID=36330 RepID=A0A1A8Z743_PLAOA|nr:conserved Plasmodium protein, unknown function [Plasmodium ovale wallikeri]SBT39607.1 conserved Plasmodium protein, unknown function [Plasmodium ovale wallikeri]SBT77835.1 conserved Plasmodium protein, unknown function [Plasmodium ovale]
MEAIHVSENVSMIKDGNRIKKIRNVSENDMIYKHRIMKYPYFKMKKIGRYCKVSKSNNFVLNRDIEIVYDYRYCSVFIKLKDMISLNLGGVTIRERCTDDMTFQVYDCLQNITLIKRKNEDLLAEDLFREMVKGMQQSD